MLEHETMRGTAVTVVTDQHVTRVDECGPVAGMTLGQYRKGQVLAAVDMNDVGFAGQFPQLARADPAQVAVMVKGKRGCLPGAFFEFASRPGDDEQAVTMLAQRRHQFRGVMFESTAAIGQAQLDNGKRANPLFVGSGVCAQWESPGIKRQL